MKLEMHTLDTDLLIFLLTTQWLAQPDPLLWVKGRSWWDADHLLIRISL